MEMNEHNIVQKKNSPNIFHLQMLIRRISSPEFKSYFKYRVSRVLQHCILILYFKWASYKDYVY